MEYIIPLYDKQFLVLKEYTVKAKTNTNVIPMDCHTIPTPNSYAISMQRFVINIPKNRI